MKSNLKIVLTILLALMMVATVLTPVLASSASLIGEIKTGYDESEGDVQAGEMTKMAGKVIRLIRTIAIILGTVVIAFLGIKYMMGSVEEKAEYKKSLIPLIVGIVVVMASTAIAELLFNVFSNT